MSQYCLGQLNLVVKYSKLGLVLALVSWMKKTKFEKSRWKQYTWKN